MWELGRNTPSVLQETSGAFLLQEREIFDRMKSELRSAANDCKLIANNPQSAKSFIRLRASLKLIEGCCRQAAHYRADVRWLHPGKQMEHAHQIARTWLHRPNVVSKKLFTKLEEALRTILKDLKRLETMKTGRTGPILTVGEPNTRLGNNWAQIPSGLIVPQGIGR